MPPTHYNKNWLSQKLAHGETVDYLFFWGHTPANPAIADKSCLSQWFPALFVVDGVSFATAEHWMMAQKAALFHDTASFGKIVASNTPRIIAAR